MGAYRYCDRCESPMIAPTIKECVFSGYSCPNCHKEQHINQFEKEYVLDDFVERFEAMEKSIKILKKKERIKIKKLKKKT